MVDKKIDGTESKESKKFIMIILIKKEIMKNTQFKVEDVFGGIISKDTIFKNK